MSSRVTHKKNWLPLSARDSPHTVGMPREVRICRDNRNTEKNERGGVSSVETILSSFVSSHGEISVPEMTVSTLDKRLTPTSIDIDYRKKKFIFAVISPLQLLAISYQSRKVPVGNLFFLVFLLKFSTIPHI